MPKIKLADNLVYYEEYGSGHPLVLLAGLSHSRLTWWKQVSALSDRFRVITPDNRDAGDSAVQEGPYSIADMALEMAALLRKLGLDAVYLMGWSMGGYISLELTLRHPELVKKLILVGTSAGGPAHVHPTSEMTAALFPHKGENIEALMRRINPILAGPNYMQEHPEDLERMVINGREKIMSYKSFQRQFAAISTWPGVSERLGQIAIPVLVVHGDADPLVRYPNGQYLAAHIADARLLTYENVGHLPPIEAAVKFNRDVLDFLE